MSDDSGWPSMAPSTPKYFTPRYYGLKHKTWNAHNLLIGLLSLYIIVHIAFYIQIKYREIPRCEMNKFELFVMSQQGNMTLVLSALLLGALTIYCKHHKK